MRVCVQGDPGGLGSHIATEFSVGAIHLDESPPADCEAVVMVVGDDPPPERRSLTEMSEAEWRAAAETAPLRAMRAFQRARSAVMPHGGSIVVIAPSVGLIGAADLAHYVSGIEAIRAMANPPHGSGHRTGLASA